MTEDFLVMLAKVITGAHGRWVGCSPDTKQRIYFANHTSNLDALVLWVVLPPEIRQSTRTVAARDYWTAGTLRRYLAEKVFQAILIERTRPTAHDNPIEQILNAMGESCSIIIFPEGGRNPGLDPMPFKSGLYHLAQKRPDMELVPVLIDNLNRVLPKGEILPVPLLGSVTFGPPIHLLNGESKTAFLDRARQALVKIRDL